MSRDEPQHVVVEKQNLFYRWLKRFGAALVVVVGLLLIVFLVLSLFFATGYPRSIAESAARSATKLEIALGGLDIDWDGQITITDLTVRLPLEEEPFALVERVEVKLSTLPLVPVEFFTSGLPSIHRIEVYEPTILARQDEEGTWNVLRAIELASAGGTPSAEPRGAPSLPISLPELLVQDARVLVQDGQGRLAELSGIDVVGSKPSSLVYEASAFIPDLQVADSQQPGVEATLLTKSNLWHRVRFDLANVGRLGEAFAGSEVPVELHGMWTGEFNANGLRGELRLDQTQVAIASVSGVLDVDVDTQPAAAVPAQPRLVRAQLPAEPANEPQASPLVTVTPRNLTLEIPDNTLRVHRGTLTATPRRARVSDLLVTAFDGEAVLEEASIDLQTLAGSFEARFRDLAPPGVSNATGEVSGALTYDSFGGPQIVVDVNGEAQAPVGYVRGSLAVKGSGPSFRQLDFIAAMPATLVRRGETNPDAQLVNLPPLAAELRLRFPEQSTAATTRPATGPTASPATAPTHVEAEVDPVLASSTTQAAAEVPATTQLTEQVPTTAATGAGGNNRLVGGTRVPFVRRTTGPAYVEQLPSTHASQPSTDPEFRLPLDEPGVDLPDVAAELDPHPPLPEDGAATRPATLPATQPATQPTTPRVPALEPEGAYIELVNLSSPGGDGSVAGRGMWAIDEQWWYLWTEARGWTINAPRVGETAINYLGLIADGSLATADHPEGMLPVRLKRVYGDVGGVLIEGDGSYRIDRVPPPPGTVDPLQLRVTLWRSIFAEPPPPVETAAADEPGQSPVEPQPPTVRGDLLSWLEVKGTLEPFELDAEGYFRSEDLVVGNIVIGDARVDLVTDINDERLVVETNDTTLFDARLRLFARVPFDEARRAYGELTIREMQLGAVGQAFGVSFVGGELSGQLRVEASGRQVSDIIASGRLEVDGLSAFDVTAANSLVLTPDVKNGLLQVDALATNFGREFEGQVTLDLTDPTSLVVSDVRADNYPVLVRLPGVERVLELDPTLRIESLTLDLERLAFAGDVDAALRLQVARHPENIPLPETAAELASLAFNDLGLLRLNVGVSEQTIELRNLEAYLLRGDIGLVPGQLGGVVTGEASLASVADVGRAVGSITGQGTINLSEPTRGRLVIRGDSFDLGYLADRLGGRLGPLEDLQGSLNWLFTIEPIPAESVRTARGDLQLSLLLEPTNTRVNGLTVGNGQLSAYVELADQTRAQPPEGTAPTPLEAINVERIATNTLRLRIGGGMLGGFFRLSQLPAREGGGGRLLSSQINLVYSGGNIGELTRATQNPAYEGEGVLDAEISAWGTIDPRAAGFDGTLGRIGGTGRVDITDARLTNFRIIEQISDIVTLGGLGTSNGGAGSDTAELRARFDGGDVFIDNSVVRAGGLTIRATGPIRNIALGSEAALDIYGVAAVTPLGQINLPFFAEANDILEAVQSNATTVHILGTVADPSVRQAAFEEVGGSLRDLILQDVQER